MASGKKGIKSKTATKAQQPQYVTEALKWLGYAQAHIEYACTPAFCDNPLDLIPSTDLERIHRTFHLTYSSSRAILNALWEFISGKLGVESIYINPCFPEYYFLDKDGQKVHYFKSLREIIDALNPIDSETYKKVDNAIYDEAKFFDSFYSKIINHQLPEKFDKHIMNQFLTMCILKVMYIHNIITDLLNIEGSVKYRIMCLQNVDWTLDWYPATDREKACFLVEQSREQSRLRNSFKIVELGENAIEALTGALRDEDYEVRRQAAYILGQIGSPRGIAPLINALKDYDWKVKKAVLDALGALGYENIIETIIPYLQYHSVYVQKAALDALGALGGEDIIETIIPYLQDHSVYVQKSAASNICKKPFRVRLDY